MNEPPEPAQLPEKVGGLIATLAKVYAREGKVAARDILANASVRVGYGSFDNWNGGTYGFLIHLGIPEALYLDTFRVKDDLQAQLKVDLNGLHNLENEFVEGVLLEVDSEAHVQRTVSPDAERRIWDDGAYRVFLSHKAAVKKETGQLAASLATFGFSCFVAHENIQPTQQWQDEIENALLSMQAFVALLTGDFHESDWTDQEVGFAVCRGVPIIAVKLGRDPYGFIGRFQALACGWHAAPLEIAKLLIKHPGALDAFIGAVETCANFDEANLLAELLPWISQLHDDQAKRLVVAYNANNQVSGSYAFNGSKPWLYGEGLAAHLSRCTGQKYEIGKWDQLQVVQ